MRIISLNANGIRAAARKGFFTWLEQAGADVVCIQETKAQREQLSDPVFHPSGYHCWYHDAERKGYSGVALYARVAPDKVIQGLGWPDFDGEGRYIEARFGKLSVASLYLPSGTSGGERQAFKFDIMRRMTPWLKKLARGRREFVICGDWNIAHRKIDIRNWRSNQKNSGFLPEERAWLDTLFDDLGLVDGFRVINQQDEQYTWWSNRGQSWAKNVGWRIDYQITTRGMAKKLRAVDIYKDQRFSDHAPLIMDYEHTLAGTAADNA